MTVGELIEHLKDCDLSAPVYTHANNHTADGPIRVSALHHYAGDGVLIGNQSKKNLNGSPERGGNWWITRQLDGAKELPDEWPRY